MPKRASGVSNAGLVITLRVSPEELASLDSLVEKMQLRFPAATRSSVLRTMLRKYLVSVADPR